MALTKWDPFEELREIQNAINRVFDDTLLRKPRRRRSGELTLWEPPIDIIETKDGYKITAELPGIDKNDVDISVSGNTLTIKAEKKQEKVEEGENYYLSERAYGLFQRQITIPEGVETDKIKASFKNGVLEITLPKGEEAKPKKIKISE